MNIQDPENTSLYIETGVTSHLHDDLGILKSFSDKCKHFFILVGDGSQICITDKCYTALGYNSFYTLSLVNVLITPQIIKNLIYVHHITCDNKCSIEFDEFGFL